MSLMPIWTPIARLLPAVSFALLAACAGVQKQPAPAEPVPTESVPSAAVTVPAVVPTTCDCPEPDPQLLPSELLVVGAVEYVVIGENVMQQKARVDTGATTTSLGIQSLDEFERDGETWVRFSIKDRVSDETADFEHRLVRRVKIKRHNAAPQERPVVAVPLTIGSVQRMIEVTLNNRDSFEYPVLVGRNFLDGHAVVDVSRKYIALDTEAP